MGWGIFSGPEFTDKEILHFGQVPWSDCNVTRSDQRLLARITPTPSAPMVQIPCGGIKIRNVAMIEKSTKSLIAPPTRQALVLGKTTANDSVELNPKVLITPITSVDPFG